MEGGDGESDKSKNEEPGTWNRGFGTQGKSAGSLSEEERSRCGGGGACPETRPGGGRGPWEQERTASVGDGP